MASRAFVALAVHVAIATAPLGPPALAQRPAVPRGSVPHDSLARDSLAGDSLARDSVRVVGHSLGMYLLLPVGAVVTIALTAVMAGVSVGYRHAHRDRTQAGLEIGLPLFVGDHTGTMRLEPTYVITRYGVLWSYRMQIAVNIPRTPYFAGLTGVGKSVPLNRSYPRQDYPKEDFFTGAVMLLFGARF